MCRDGRVRRDPASPEAGTRSPLFPPSPGWRWHVRRAPWGTGWGPPVRPTGWASSWGSEHAQDKSMKGLWRSHCGALWMKTLRLLRWEPIAVTSMVLSFTGIEYIRNMTPACFAYRQEICFKKCPSPLHASLAAERSALKNVFLPDSFSFNVSPSSMLEFPAMAFMIGRRILPDRCWDSPVWLGLCRYQQKTHDYTIMLILPDRCWDSPVWLGLCRYQQKTHDYTIMLILPDRCWDSPVWLGLCRYQQKTHDYTIMLILPDRCWDSPVWLGLCRYQQKPHDYTIMLILPDRCWDSPVWLGLRRYQQNPHDYTIMLIRAT